MLRDAALATRDVCCSKSQRQGTCAHQPASPLHPAASPSAPPPLGPPESPLSDGVGTGGDALGAAAAVQVGPGGLFRGVSSAPAAERAPATFPDPQRAKDCHFPTGGPALTRGSPACTPVTPYPQIFSTGSRNGARSPARSPLRSPNPPATKSPGPPPAGVAPRQHLRGPAHGWQRGSGPPGAWGWTCLKYFPCCISTRATLPPPLPRGQAPAPPLPTSPPFLLGGGPTDTQASRKQENQVLLMSASFQGDIGTPPTPPQSLGGGAGFL